MFWSVERMSMHLSVESVFCIIKISHALALKYAASLIRVGTDEFLAHKSRPFITLSLMSLIQSYIGGGSGMINVPSIIHTKYREALFDNKIEVQRA